MRRGANAALAFFAGAVALCFTRRPADELTRRVIFLYAG
jgi:hypothetical protein